ncbi:MAG TPA: transporter [Verrucomicrobiae bacterium]
MNLKHTSKSMAVATLTLSGLAFCPVAQAQTIDPKAVENFATAVPGGSTSLSEADLAKDLQNPVADLISVPLENRFDFGPGTTLRYTLNIQPVVPFRLTENWMVVSRTILPVVYAESPVPGGAALGGIGDITQSFFFAPKEPTAGWIWGAGPVLRLPTATRNIFGEERWGAGPTAVALRQDGPWTYGALVNHVWSFAGWGPENVNTTYLQPFLAYTTDTLTTIGVGTETGYSWTQNQWTVPLDASVSQLVQFGKLPVEFGVGFRVYAERPDGGPNWGMKFTMTFVFPTK